VPAVTKTLTIGVGREVARTWVLASASLLRYELKGEVTDDGVSFYADLWVLDDDSVQIDVAISPVENGTTVSVTGRNRPGKMLTEAVVADRAERMVTTLRGFDQARIEGREIPGRPPPKAPPGK
jgi:hypothetical protein